MRKTQFAGPPPAPPAEALRSTRPVAREIEQGAAEPAPSPGSSATMAAAMRPSDLGTHLHGIEGLRAPNPDGPKLRLVAGRIVPGTRYRIIRWLGEGGMGVVYEAEHVDIERRVALKILRFDLSQEPAMVQVFRDEARAASRLGSKYVVEIYDFGELSDGRLFFAMELLQGSDLVPASDDATMDPARLIAILRQVCKGLHDAHQAGIVHRDIKPENIIASRVSNRDDAVKLVDFGISAMLAAGTNMRGIAGTPQYMAPEQIREEPFDGRLDIYGLGCTAYELLVGRPPFRADHLMGLLHMQLTETPAPPRKVRPELDVPIELEAVILRCLAKDPAQRFRDMADLEAALCEAQIASGITTPWDDLPLPDLPDLERRDRILREMPSPIPMARPRRRWFWPAAAGLSTMAAGMLAAFLGFYEPPARTSDAVDTLTTEARAAASKANWVVPPPSAPDDPTAFAKVVELEAVDGTAEDLADERGQELRQEFATTLVGHGDKLWDHGVQQLAREYYLWALAFDPGNEHAFARAGTTHALLSDFLRRAAERDFTAAERIISRLVAANDIDDPAEREALMAELDQATGELSFESELVVASAAKRAGLQWRPGKREEIADEEKVLTEEELQAEREEVLEILEPPVPDEQPPAEAEPAAPSDAGQSKTKRRRRARRMQLGSNVDLSKAERDPAKAQELADEGQAALRQGRRGQATELFNQAIAFDHRNATALMGLSDVFFDTGHDQKAVIFAEKAVGASPRNDSYRLKLGDAYFKVLRYRDALKQYERAHELGSSRASSRIARVNQKLGG